MRVLSSKSCLFIQMVASSTPTAREDITRRPQRLAKNRIGDSGDNSRSAGPQGAGSKRTGALGSVCRWRRERDGIVLKAVASTLGILAMIAAMVVGALAATGVLSHAPTSSQVGGSQASLKEEGAPQTKPAAKLINESVSAGDLSWTVVEVRQVSELRSYTFPPTTLRGNFLVVTFTVENTSDAPITLTEDSMALLDEEGLRDSPAASINSEYVEPQKAILFNEGGLLEPGEKREGKVNFDLSGVPLGIEPSTDLSGLRLKLGDADPTVEEERLVDLGL
jgi:hypothetical protein